MGDWKRERKFCTLLRHAVRHLTRERLKRVTRIAVEDHRCCYKHLIVILKHEAQIANKHERLNLLYVLSDVLLTIHHTVGAGNRLTNRFLDSVESTLPQFASCPLAKRLKVLSRWAEGEVFTNEDFRLVRRILLEDESERTKERQWQECESPDESSRAKRHCTNDSILSSTSKSALSTDVSFSPGEKCVCVGPFGLPYSLTWGFGEGRDGYEMRQKYEQTQFDNQINWIEICEQIANSVRV